MRIRLQPKAFFQSTSFLFLLQDFHGQNFLGNQKRKKENDWCSTCREGSFYLLTLSTGSTWKWGNPGEEVVWAELMLFLGAESEFWERALSLEATGDPCLCSSPHTPSIWRTLQPQVAEVLWAVKPSTEPKTSSGPETDPGRAHSGPVITTATSLLKNSAANLGRLEVAKSSGNGNTGLSAQQHLSLQLHCPHSTGVQSIIKYLESWRPGVWCSFFHPDATISGCG